MRQDHHSTVAEFQTVPRLRDALAHTRWPQYRATVCCGLVCDEVLLVQSSPEMKGLG